MGDAWIGTYQIRKVLGGGGMASVYECHDEALGRSVAVKVLHPHLANDDTATARFLREGRAVSRIRHPNVVQMFDSGQSDGLPYLVMELVDGSDLAKYLRDSGVLPIETLADFMLAVIAAVGAAHDAGIVHRDLKPSNILLFRNHRGEIAPKVVDFGISKLLADDDNSDLTQTGGVLGTTSYMAPEQLRSARSADARSDVYSIGVILYECATGKLPFNGNSQYDLMHAVLTAPVAAPSSLRPGLPPALDAIVLRAMRRDPADRFASAHDLGLALVPLARDSTTWRQEFAARASEEPSSPFSSAPHEMASSPVTVVSAIGFSKSSQRPRGSRRTALGAGVVLAAVAAMSVAVTHRTPSPRPPRSAALAQSDPAHAIVETSVRTVTTWIDAGVQASDREAIPARTRRQVHALGTTAITGAATATRHPTLHQELGTNGAPILE